MKLGHVIPAMMYFMVFLGAAQPSNGISFAPIGSVGFGNISDKPYSLAISPEGQHIAIACGMGVVIARKSDNGFIFERLLTNGEAGAAGKYMGIQVVEFIDPEYVLGGSEDGKLWMWNINKPLNPVMLDKGDGQFPVVLAAGIDKDNILTVYANNEYHILSGVSPYGARKIFKGNLFVDKTVGATAYNYSDKMLAVAPSGENTIYFFKIEDRKLKPLSPVHLSISGVYRSSLRYSRDGKRLVYASSNQIVLIASKNNRVLKTISTSQEVSSAEFSLDLKYLFVSQYSSTSAATIKVIPLQYSTREKKLRIKELPGIRINFMLFLPAPEPSKGTLLIAAPHYRAIALDITSGLVSWSIDGFINEVTTDASESSMPPMEFLSDSTLMFISQSNFLFINSVNARITGSVPNTYPSIFVGLAGPLPNGKVVALSYDGTLLFFKGNVLTDSIRIGQIDAARTMDVVKNRIFVIDTKGKIIVIDERGNIKKIIKLGSGGTPMGNVTALRAVSMKSGGYSLFVGTDSGTLIHVIYKEPDMIENRIIPGTGDEITSIEYSPTSMVLAVGYLSGKIDFYADYGGKLSKFLDFDYIKSRVIKMKFIKNSSYLLAVSAYALFVLNVKADGVDKVYSLPRKDIWNMAVSPSYNEIAILHTYGNISFLQARYDLDFSNEGPVVVTSASAPKAAVSASPKTVSEQLIPPQAPPSQKISTMPVSSSVAGTEQPPSAPPESPSPQPVIASKPTIDLKATTSGETSYQGGTTHTTQYSTQSIGTANIAEGDFRITSPAPRGGVIRVDYSPATVIQFSGEISPSLTSSMLSFHVERIWGGRVAYNSQSLEVKSDGKFDFSVTFYAPGIYRLFLNASTGTGQTRVREYVVLVGEVTNIYLIVYALNAPSDPEFPVASSEFEASASLFWNDLKRGLNIARSNRAYFVGKNAVPDRFLDKLRSFVSSAGDTGIVIVGIFAPVIGDPQNPSVFRILGYYTRASDVVSRSMAGYEIQSILSSTRGRKILFFDGVKSEMLRWYYNRIASASVYQDFNDFLESVNDNILSMQKSAPSMCLISASQMQTESYSVKNMGLTLMAQVIDEGIKGRADYDSDGVVRLGELTRYLDDRMTQIVVDAQPGIAGPCDNSDVPLSVLKLLSQ